MWPPPRSDHPVDQHPREHHRRTQVDVSARSISSTDGIWIRALPGRPALATRTSTGAGLGEQPLGRLGAVAEVARDRRVRRSRRRATRAPRAPPRQRQLRAPARRARARSPGPAHPSRRSAAPSHPRDSWPAAPPAARAVARVRRTPPGGGEAVQERLAAHRADLARREEARGRRAGERLGDHHGVVVGAPEHAAAAPVAGEQQRARGRPPAERGMRTPSASRRSRSALLGVAGVQPHDLPRVDVGGDRHLPGRRRRRPRARARGSRPGRTRACCRRRRSPSAARPAPERGRSGGERLDRLAAASRAPAARPARR